MLSSQTRFRCSYDATDAKLVVHLRSDSLSTGVNESVWEEMHKTYAPF